MGETAPKQPEKKVAKEGVAPRGISPEEILKTIDAISPEDDLDALRSELPKGYQLKLPQRDGAAGRMQHAPDNLRPTTENRTRLDDTTFFSEANPDPTSTTKEVPISPAVEEYLQDTLTRPGVEIKLPSGTVSEETKKKMKGEDKEEK